MLIKTSFKNSATVLLLAEVVLIASSAWWPQNSQEPLWILVPNATLFCLGGYLLAKNTHWLKAYIPLAILAVTFNFFGHAVPATIGRWLALNGVIAILFWAVLKHSFLRKNVPKSDRILAGVAGYLLIGIFWSRQFSTLSELGLAPLRNLSTSQLTTPSENLYFGFVTLTAVGYGEIVPATPLARALTIFAALSGVLYLAIFISILVSRPKE